MKTIVLSLAVLFLSNSSFAQANSKEQKIKQLLEVTGAGKMGVQVSQQMLSSFKTNFKEVPPEFWEKMAAAINAADMVNMLMPVYAKYYTEQDLDQLIAFYKTPIGQKTIAVTPPLMQECMQLGQAWGEEIANKVYKELEKEGYKKEK